MRLFYLISCAIHYVLTLPSPTSPSSPSSPSSPTSSSSPSALRGQYLSKRRSMQQLWSWKPLRVYSEIFRRLLHKLVFIALSCGWMCLNVHACVAPTFVTSTNFVTAHQFYQFISTASVNLTTFVNFCHLRAHQFCQQYQPLMSLKTRSLLLSTRPDHFCQP